VSAAAPGLGAVLRAELAPVAGRWRQSLLVATGTTVALAFAVILQVGTFVAPVMAYIALQPTSVCSWRALLRRLATAALAAIVLLHAGGVVVQLPWLLLPFFFVLITVLSYCVSMITRPLDVLAIMYSVIMVMVTGLFDPSAVGNATLTVVSGYCIGIIVGTVFAELVFPERPRDRLAAALAEGFARGRRRLQVVVQRYQGQAPVAPIAAAAAASSLADYVRLFDLVRQEEIGAAAEHGLLALMIAAERTHVAITVAEALADEEVGRTYRWLLRGELTALSALLDTALASFERAARRAERLLAATPSPTPAWPDLAAAVRAVQGRQSELREAGALAAIDVAEASNTNAFVQTLAGLVDVMHVAPEQLVHMAATDPTPDLAGPLPPRSLFRVDPFAARWSLQVGLAVTIAYVLVVVSHVYDFFTALWNPLFIAQASYGATIRKASLRIAGIVVGSVVGVLTIIALMPNITGLAAFLVFFFAVLVPCQYVALGSPRVAYGGLQTAFTFMIIVVGDAPVTEVDRALWRTFGVLVGTACLFLVFRLVAPDYAGRQLIARFRDLLRSMLMLLPRSDVAPLPSARLLQARRDIGTGAGDIMRLADEASLEGDCGVDPRAAVDAVGLATRIGHRCALVHRSRLLTPWPPMSPDTRAVLREAETAISTRLARLLHVVEARHTTARPGSQRHEQALAAAVTAAGAPRADVAQPLARLARHLEAVRFTELASWPAAASGALFAELEHLQRLADLLERLEERLLAAIAPAAPAH
jgi:multidrug resistance protein MdtO